VAAFAGFCLHNGPDSLGEFPLDDAWITQVYTRGMLRDHVPTYNPGEPETGFSSPLWMITSLPFHALGSRLGSVPVAAKIESLLFAVACAAVLALLAWRLGCRPWIAGAAALLSFASPGFLFSSVAGMEVTLTALLVATAFVLVAHERHTAAGWALGLAVLARPEALVFPPLLAALCARRRQAMTRLLFPPLVCVLGWMCANLLLSGQPLPNTIVIKTTKHEHPLGARARYFAEAVLLGQGPAYLALHASLWAVALYAAAARRLLATLALALAALAGGIVLTHPLIPNVTYYCQRYFYPFTILGVVLSTAGLEVLARRRHGRWLAPAALAIAALASLPAIARARVDYREHCHGIAELHTKPALEFIRATPPGSVVGVEGAGAARFFGERTIVDLVGLNAGWIAHTSDLKARSCLIALRGMTHLVVPPYWLPPLAEGFEIRTTASWRLPPAKIDREAHTVVAAELRVRPAVEQRCRLLLGPSPE
jgi:hypothetical protein